MFDANNLRINSSRSLFSKFDPLWTSLVEFGPFLIHFGQVWSSSDKFYPIWAILIQSEQLWMNLIRFDPIWTSLIKYGQVWSKLNKFDPFWTMTNILQTKDYKKFVVSETMTMNFFEMTRSSRPKVFPRGCVATQQRAYRRLLCTLQFYMTLSVHRLPE